MFGYGNIYSPLSEQPSLQKQITNYMVSLKMSAQNECEVASSSDKSDFEPFLHKKILIHDYEE